jgi:hypothetical protein
MSETNLHLSMENNLVSHLRPVQPNPDFILKLGDRLLGSKDMFIEDRNHALGFMLISVGLFVGALIVWLFHKNRKLNQS